ncbi:type III pantothenate kinase [Thiocapsa imhoffii]
MMLLLLDVGNTNLCWTRATSDGATARLSSVQRVRHGGAIPLDLLAEWEGYEVPERVILSHVGDPGVVAALTRVVMALWGVRIEFVRTRARFGAVRIAYGEPARFGVDRWLALVAAHALEQRATLIVDAGSAATFDLLLADGRHLGGLILPGVEMMRQSLLAGTQIPRIAGEPAELTWAQDTGSAVAAGSLLAISALASRLYDRLREEVGAEPKLLLTGGDAERVQPAIERPCEVREDLVLRGLLQVALDETATLD